ncbi:LAS seventeen-binding protein [Tolypocladium capitatum]|uniref:LAS seventeen-binding protein n=1 Tax=Tolypocladium capitatum TaxID=45235 RepID=A0A2K3QKV9_9HYPO|nr:LAS seventeen-binding protein [Tolypocladium capitatum]
MLTATIEKGVYADPGAGQPPTSTHPQAKESAAGVIDPTKEKPKSRVLVTIPPKVISRALGLAIFTTLRAGFQFSGATGSGILIARLPDGSWGPPSGIQVLSVGGGFQIGLDIYDCVCVINSKEALAAFTNTRVSLGSDLAVVAGPYGAGGAVDFGTAVEGRKEEDAGRKDPNTDGTAPQHGQQSQNLQPDGAAKKSHGRSLSSSAFKPVFSYVKSRGFYAGVQVDGTVFVERKDANAAFYGAQVTVDQVLKGQIPSPQQASPNMWPAGARTLLGVLKGAEAGALSDSHGGDSTTPVAGDHAGSSAPPPPPPPPPYQDDGSHAGVGDVKYELETGTTRCDMDQFAIYPSLRGKTVLITGAAEGIGASAVELFCRQGSNVVFLDYSESSAKALCDKIKGIEGAEQPTFMFCDVTNLDQLKACASKTLERFGQVHVLINNCGAAGPESRVPTSRVTPESFEADVNVNLRHQFFMTQAVVPSMQTHGSGCIINMGSITWRLPATGLPIYTAVKAAVMGMTRTHAREFGEFGIRVNSIMPGAIATQRQIDTVLTPEYEAETISGQCIKRVLMPVEVARLMLFLASDDASAITGGSHVVDGGWVGDT